MVVVKDSERLQSSSPSFLTHPFNTALISFFTLSLSTHAFTSPYVLCPFLLLLFSVADNAVLPIIAAIARHSVHIARRDMRLAPRVSNCRRPCKTPPISVSCHVGVHTAERLLAIAFSGAAKPRRDHVNSRVVVLTVKGWNLYPPFQFSWGFTFSTSLRRPEAEKARSQAEGTSWDAGRMRLSR